MAADEDTGTGSKDRATVALVYRAVDDLGKTVDAEFRAVNARLDTFAALPAQVAAQHELLTLLQARVLLTENRLDEQDKRDNRRDDADVEYRRIHKPTLVISTLALIVAILTLASLIVANT